MKDLLEGIELGLLREKIARKFQSKAPNDEFVWEEFNEYLSKNTPIQGLQFLPSWVGNGTSVEMERK